MANGLNKTKRRIASIRSTKKITKAMGMVATVKLKRFQGVYSGEKDYVEGLESTMASLFAFDPKSRSHYAKENENAEGSLVIFITSDLGLCASYNANLFAYLDTVIDKSKDTVLPLGQKGISHLSRIGGYRFAENDYGLSLDSDAEAIVKACKGIREDFNAGKYRSIKIIYTHYVNSLRFDPSIYTLLPFSLTHEVKEEEEYCPPLFEPSPREQIHLLMGYYLAAVLGGLLDESQLSEQASRRNAMDNANDNADELLDQLSVEYNKARQAAITQEITEVVAGSSNAK